MDAAKISFLLFTVFSSLRIVSYLPQIRKVALDRNGATAISYSTWSLWTGANLATAFYAAINLHDLYLSAVSAIYAICCIVVILLTALKRGRLRLASAEAGKSARPAAHSDAERCAAIEALRITVKQAAAALAAKRRPRYSFEQDLATHARQVVWYDAVTTISTLPVLRAISLSELSESQVNGTTETTQRASK